MFDDKGGGLGLLLRVTVLATICGCAHAPKRSAPPGSNSHPELLEPPMPPSPAQPQRAGGEACQLGTIYFAFDSALLDKQARDTAVAAIACYTHSKMPERLALTGSTDPRGTEEYNLALGHRRAAAVQTLLTTLGVTTVRISVTSVGEEKATGSDEDGWRLDRHVVATSE